MASCSFLTFRLNPNICLWVFIIRATEKLWRRQNQIQPPPTAYENALDIFVNPQSSQVAISIFPLLSQNLLTSIQYSVHDKVSPVLRRLDQFSRNPCN